MANIDELAEKYVASINSPVKVEDDVGRKLGMELDLELRDQRHPIKAAAGNLAFDLGASAGLFGKSVQAFRGSNIGRLADFFVNMWMAHEAGAREDPYGDFQVATGSSGIPRFAPARPTGYGSDVMARDAVDSAIGVAQWIPLTAIPATMVTGTAHQQQHDNVRAKKALEIKAIQDRVKAINPKDPTSRSQLLYYAAQLKGLTGTGEIARGTLGQAAYGAVGQAEDARRRKDAPLDRAFRAYKAPGSINTIMSGLPEQIVTEGDKILQFEADMSKMANSSNAITYPLKRARNFFGIDYISDQLSPDRLWDTISGELPGSFFSQQNFDAYRAKKKFHGKNVGQTPEERRAEIRTLAEEAYPGVTAEVWFDHLREQERKREEARIRQEKMMVNSRVLNKF